MVELKEYYARHAQDKVVAELLKYKRKGVFIDLGATDGITSNNTFLFEHLYDWTGICVEPNNDYFDKLKVNRKCKCLNICVGSTLQEGIVTFKEDKGNAELSKISTTEGNSYKPCISLNKVLDSLRIFDIDFLSIDTEGNELEIIRDFNFLKFSVKCICFEHNEYFGELYKHRKQEMEKILLLSGFTKLRDIDSDSIYYRD
jgi:FkbM family methyltransferase